GDQIVRILVLDDDVDDLELRVLREAPREELVQRPHLLQRLDHSAHSTDSSQPIPGASSMIGAAGAVGGVSSTHTPHADTIGCVSAARGAIIVRHKNAMPAMITGSERRCDGPVGSISSEMRRSRSDGSIATSDEQRPKRACAATSTNKRAYAY